LEASHVLGDVLIIGGSMLAAVLVGWWIRRRIRAVDEDLKDAVKEQPFRAFIFPRDPTGMGGG
jgi:hypothetical protein